MPIRRIEFEHFKSYRTKQSLDLWRRGLVLLRGRNRVSASLDANGVGKTGVIDAISYGLFGVTLARLRGEDVACRFTEEPCRVRVELEDERGPWAITRTRRPASLVIEASGEDALHDKIPALQHEYIRSRLGFGYRTFCSAWVFGQGAFDRFCHATPDEQMGMLDEIQGIDLRGALKRAVDWRAEVSERFWRLEREQDVLAEKIKTWKEAQATLQDQMREFSRMHKQRVADTESRTQAVHRALIAATDQLKGLLAMSALVPTLRERHAALRSAHDAVKAGDQRVTLMLANKHAAERAREQRLREIDTLSSAGACPTCRAPVPERSVLLSSFADHLRAHDQAVAVRSTAVESAERELHDAKQALNKASAAYLAVYHKFPNALQQAMTTVSEQLESLGNILGPLRGLSHAEQTVKQAESALADAQREEAAVKAERWTGREALEVFQRDISRGERERDAAQDSALRAERTVKAADYWIEAFGNRGIRSLLFDNLAGYLNERLAHHLHGLTHGEATAAFAPFRELKSGEQREALTFNVVWSWGGVSDQQSGGQQRRSDLAVFAALQDVAELRSAKPFGLKVWDEPGDALDRRGQEKFAEWIAREARARGTGILITQSVDLESLVNPDVTWTVTLTNDGATIEEQ